MDKFKNDKPKDVIIIGDFARDLDDEHTLVLAATLHKLGFINLIAVIGNLAPAEERARVAKGTLQQLGLPDIPVGIGTPVFEGKTHAYEANVSYMSSDEDVEEGKVILSTLLRLAEDKSISLVLNSGLTDCAELLQEYEHFFVDKVDSVSIMGGIQTHCDGRIKMTGKYFQPDDSANVAYDWPNGTWLYAKLQELGIPMTLLTRNAAYAAQVPFSMYDDMEKTGNPVGINLKSRQKPAIEGLWKAACSSVGAEIRGTLPPTRDREWFVNTFCHGEDPGIEDSESIWNYVGEFNLYDPMNLISSIPELRDRFFSPTVVEVNDVKHLVMGISKEKHNIKDINALKQFMIDCELAALKGE